MIVRQLEVNCLITDPIQLLAVDHEFKKKRLNVFMLWSQIEGLAMFTKLLSDNWGYNS